MNFLTCLWLKTFEGILVMDQSTSQLFITLSTYATMADNVATWGTRVAFSTLLFRNHFHLGKSSLKRPNSGTQAPKESSGPQTDFWTWFVGGPLANPCSQPFTIAEGVWLQPLKSWGPKGTYAYGPKLWGPFHLPLSSTCLSKYNECSSIFFPKGK